MKCVPMNENEHQECIRLHTARENIENMCNFKGHPRLWFLSVQHYQFSSWLGEIIGEVLQEQGEVHWISRFCNIRHQCSFSTLSLLTPSVLWDQASKESPDRFLAASSYRRPSAWIPHIQFLGILQWEMILISLFFPDGGESGLARGRSALESQDNMHMA